MNRFYVETDFGHRDPGPTVLMDLDHTVSSAEQQDYLPPVGEPAAWQVICLGLSPLFVVGVVSLIAHFIFR